MRWALPFIAAVVTFGLSLIGAPHASGYGAVPMRHEATLRLAAMPRVQAACGLMQPPASGLEAVWQAAAGARWDPAALWTGLLMGSPDSPLAAGWRGFVDYSKGRDAAVARRPGCAPNVLAAR